MSRKRKYIFATAVLAVGLGGSWLAIVAGGGGRAVAQDVRPATQPETDRDRDRDRDRESRRDRRQGRDRRRDRDEVEEDARGERSSRDRTTAQADERRDGTPAVRESAPRGREDFTARFAIVYEKNIFLRDRPTYSPNARGVTPTTSPLAPRRPEESYVLTGIKLEEGRHVAFIENTGGGTTQRVPIGGAIAGGKVVDLDLDALEYEAGGKRTRIEVGRNLAGAVVFTPPPAPPSSTAAAAPRPAGSPPAGGAAPFAAAPGAAPGGAPGGAPGDPNNPNLTVEERMKLRRAQQLGGK